MDESLKRLETDYVDFFWIHRFDPDTPIEETMRALHDLVIAGKIRYLGASSMWAHQFAMMQFCAEKNGWTKFIAMQVSTKIRNPCLVGSFSSLEKNRYSLLYREDEREMNKFCNATGVAIVPVSRRNYCFHLSLLTLILVFQWGPLAEGQLARPLSTRGTTARSAGGAEPRAESKEIINRVEELSKKKGWTMSQVTLAWMMKRVTAPIIGFSSVERIEEALSARGKELTDEEEKYLEEVYTPVEIEGHF